MRSEAREGNRAVVAALCLLGALGCDAMQRGSRDASGGDVYWLQAPAPGHGQMIVPRWRLDWIDGEPAVEEIRWRVTRGAEASLALLGRLPTSDPGEASAGRVAGELSRAALDLQNQGLVVAGIHLEFDRGARDEVRPEWLATWLARFRGALDDSLRFSVSVAALRPEAISAEIDALGSGPDWVLVDLYGQPPSAPDQPALWDLEAAVARLRAMGEAGLPARGRIWLSGSLDLASSPTGENVTGDLPCDLLADLAMRSESVFQFEGYYRQVFETDGRLRALRLGEREIPVGDRLRVTRVTPAHLRGLLASLEAEEPGRRYLGLVYALPDVDGDNCLALGREDLAVARRPLQRVPTVRMEQLAPDRFLVVAEGGSETTGLARTKHNFVDVVASSGEILEVEMNGFGRYEFLDGSRRPVAQLTGRGVRLFVPMLDDGGRAAASLVHSGDPGGFSLTPVFLSPTGELLAVEQVRWPSEGTDGPDRADDGAADPAEPGP